MRIALGIRRAGIRRTGFVTLVTLVLGGLLGLGLSAPAFADPSLTLTLKLTNKAGAALAGYDVYPIDVSDGSELPYDDPDSATPVAGKSGYYSMLVTPGDTYTLWFSPAGAAVTSGTIQYLGGTASLAGATTFTPTTTNNFIAASIATGGTITGKVTGPTGAVLSNAEVDAYQFDGTSWTTSIYTHTNSSGVFTFANAVPGSYRFEFYSAGGIYPPIYSGGATTLSAAATTFVQVGATSTVNQKFAAGTGAISGIALVNFPDYGNLPDNDRVPVAIPVTSASGSGTTIDPDKSVAGAPAGGTGAWTVKNLPAGRYVVELFPGYLGESTVFLATGSDGTTPVTNDTSLADATVLTVVAGKTTPTGTTVFQGSEESDGANPQYTIVDTAGDPVENADVTLAPTTNPFDIAGGVSGADGTVGLSDSLGDISDDDSGGETDNPLTPGWYTLTVIDPTGAHDPYREEVFLDYGTAASTVIMPDLTGRATFSTAASISQSASGQAVGTQYTATATPTRADAVLTYQWLRTAPGGSVTQIYGATDASYVSTGADLGDTLSVRVTATSFGFVPAYSYTSVAGVTTVGPALVNATPPDVVPATSIFVGTTLQAHVGAWTLNGSATDGIHYSYDWQRNGQTEVPAQTGTSYVVQPADIGQNITVVVTASKLGYGSASATQSYAIVPAAHPAPIVTKAPVVTAKAVKSVTTYSVSPGTWNTAGVAFSYQWSVGSTQLNTTSSITSTQVAAALGHALPESDPLTVVVTATRLGYLHGASATIVAVKGTSTFSQSAAPEIFDTTAGADFDGTDAIHYGDHLTVKTHGAWALQSGSAVPSSYSYKWYRNGVAIAGATTASYVVAAADLVGSPEITVVETAASAQYPAAVSLPTQVGQVVYASISAAAPLTIVGPSEDGQLDSVAVGAWGATAVVNHYQWYACPTTETCTDATPTSDYVAIAKATLASLVVHASYKWVFVKVTGSKTGYSNLPTESDPFPVQPATVVTNTATPTVVGTTSGLAHVGVKLTATTGAWSVSKPTFGYQWQTSTDGTSWTSITGATAATYTPTGAVYATGGVDIRVEVTASKAGVSTSADAASHVIAPGTLVLKTAPKLTITTATDAVSAGVVSPAVTPTYQWSVDGSADTIDAPGSATRTRQPDDAGKAIYVYVSYSLQGYTSLAPVRLVAQKGTLVKPTEAITGGTQYGDTLAVGTPTPFSDPAGGAWTTTYQWYVGSVAISKATLKTYVVPSAYINKVITVRVTGTSLLYNTLIVTSAPITIATGTFGAANIPTLSYTGTLQPGTVVTARPDAADYGTSAIVYTYKWERSVGGGVLTAIAGATKATYTPIATDATDGLAVVVTAAKVGFVPRVLTSVTSVVQYSPALQAFVPPTLVGTSKVGGALAVAVGTWNTPTLTYTYQWFRNGLQIGGVTAAGWTPTADSVGDTIVVQVTASRVGWLPVTVSTQQLFIAPADAPVASIAPVITVAGGVYSVSPGSWNVDGLTYTYQWKLNTQPIEGATSASYTAASGDAGTLSVDIQTQRTGYSPAVKTITYAKSLVASA